MCPFCLGGVGQPLRVPQGVAICGSTAGSERQRWLGMLHGHVLVYIAFCWRLGAVGVVNVADLLSESAACSCVTYW